MEITVRVGNAVASDDARRHKGDTCLRATPHHKHYVGLRWGPQNSKTNAQEEEIRWVIVRFLHKYLQMSDIFRTFATQIAKQQQKSNNMEAALRQPTVIPGHVKPCATDTRSSMEAKKPHFSLNPDWREQPVRSWAEVYDELCQEVGRAYGLNDIREA